MSEAMKFGSNRETIRSKNALTPAAIALVGLLNGAPADAQPVTEQNRIEYSTPDYQRDMKELFARKDMSPDEFSRRLNEIVNKKTSADKQERDREWRQYIDKGVIDPALKILEGVEKKK